MKGIFPLVVLSTQKVWIFKFAKLMGSKWNIKSDDEMQADFKNSSYESSP